MIIFGRIDLSGSNNLIATGTVKGNIEILMRLEKIS